VERGAGAPCHFGHIWRSLILCQYVKGRTRCVQSRVVTKCASVHIAAAAQQIGTQIAFLFNEQQLPSAAGPGGTHQRNKLHQL
jgi:hypothetical protein